MPELLIELFSEEIPARMQRRAAEDFKGLVTDGLKKANLDFADARAYWTPRRLVLVVDGLPETQPDLREERKGPKVGAPDQAIAGFLKGAGLDSIDQCEQRETPKGPVWFAVTEKKGGATAIVLPTVIEAAVRALPWPKSMRFADQEFRWVRPFHSMIAVFGGKPVEGALDRRPGTLAFGDTTHGHRFLGSGNAFNVTGFDDYVQKLRAEKVILDPEERKEAIALQLREKADREGLTLQDDAGLLEEVTGLVEWPQVLIGRIDDEFMEVPPEVLTASMRAHQKYFTLNRPDGSMAPRFAVVANMEAADGGAAIVAGNERVLRARLADAKFFWDQDRKTRLEDRIGDLEKVIFHAKLGTVAERVERIAALARDLSEYIPDADRDMCDRAARLAKADLTTEMVGEFPELQGLMGRYYALDQGEDPAVADAIAQHYSPAGPSDACPAEPTAIAVALAEKLDTLLAFWIIDEKPTGSKDPFALRRAALGGIRLILENGLRMSLLQVFYSHETPVLLSHLSALEQQNLKNAVSDIALHKISNATRKQLAEVVPGYSDDRSHAPADLLRFFADRLRVHLKDEGVSHDLIQALFALGDEDDLVRLVARVHALRDFVASEDGANLLTAYRRAANILKAEEKKDGVSHDGSPDPGHFRQPEEEALWTTLSGVAAQVGMLIEDEDYAGAMRRLATLREPVDAFFDQVTVNTDEADLRKNRLMLLSNIRRTMNALADFGLVEG